LTKTDKSIIVNIPSFTLTYFKEGKPVLVSKVVVGKIDAAMNRGVEETYNLKTKIPVYIGYFTAWVDRDGQIYFYEDIYGHDERLSIIVLSDL
jgi:murein L,D-transpeptidase YcbB/YkuD